MIFIILSLFVILTAAIITVFVGAVRDRRNPINLNRESKIKWPNRRADDSDDDSKNQTLGDA